MSIIDLCREGATPSDADKQIQYVLNQCDNTAKEIESYYKERVTEISKECDTRLAAVQDVYAKNIVYIRNILDQGIKDVQHDKDTSTSALGAQLDFALSQLHLLMQVSGIPVPSMAQLEASGLTSGGAGNASNTGIPVRPGSGPFPPTIQQLQGLPTGGAKPYEPSKPDSGQIGTTGQQTQPIGPPKSDLYSTDSSKLPTEMPKSNSGFIVFPNGVVTPADIISHPTSGVPIGAVIQGISYEVQNPPRPGAGPIVALGEVTQAISPSGSEPPRPGTLPVGGGIAGIPSGTNPQSPSNLPDIQRPGSGLPSTIITQTQQQSQAERPGTACDPCGTQVPIGATPYSDPVDMSQPRAFRFQQRSQPWFREMFDWSAQNTKDYLNSTSEDQYIKDYEDKRDSRNPITEEPDNGS